MSIRSSCYRGLEHDDVLLPAGRLQLGPIGCIQQQPRDRRDHDGAPPCASWLIRPFPATRWPRMEATGSLRHHRANHRLLSWPLSCWLDADQSIVVEQSWSVKWISVKFPSFNRFSTRSTILIDSLVWINSFFFWFDKVSLKKYVMLHFSIFSFYLPFYYSFICIDVYIFLLLFLG